MVARNYPLAHQTRGDGGPLRAGAPFVGLRVWPVSHLFSALWYCPQCLFPHGNGADGGYAFCRFCQEVTTLHAHIVRNARRGPARAYWAASHRLLLKSVAVYLDLSKKRTYRSRKAVLRAAQIGKHKDQYSRPRVVLFAGGRRWSADTDNVRGKAMVNSLLIQKVSVRADKLVMTQFRLAADTRDFLKSYALASGESQVAVVRRCVRAFRASAVASFGFAQIPDDDVGHMSDGFVNNITA